MGFNFTRETTALRKEKNSLTQHTHGRKENTPDSAESRHLSSVVDTRNFIRFKQI